MIAARTSRQMRIAYQCKWLIDQTSGECTIHDMAKFTGESWQACLRACRDNGWQTLFRKTMKDFQRDQGGRGAKRIWADGLLFEMREMQGGKE